jgi:DNA polymerase I-like protein with 3'-5' exonuclease and polymerase domains
MTEEFIKRATELAEAEETDLHTASASLYFDVPVSEVTVEQRHRAKQKNFCALYGGVKMENRPQGENT